MAGVGPPLDEEDETRSLGPPPAARRETPGWERCVRAGSETSASRAPAPRLQGLDLVRAAAITWVLIYHGSLFGLTSQSHWLVANGWMGVDLFFVLSGFLIAGQLLRPWLGAELSAVLRPPAVPDPARLSGGPGDVLPCSGTS